MFLRPLAWVRLVLLPLALVQLLRNGAAFPDGYEQAAWVLLAVQSAFALALFVLARQPVGDRLPLLGLCADAAVVLGLVLVYAFEDGHPLRALLFLIVLEAALIYRVRGGLVAAGVVTAFLAFSEWWRSREFDAPAEPETVVVRGLIAAVLGGVVGRLLELESDQAREATARAAEAERLRDDLGRRVNVLEAANRCAHALGSSLDLDRAFAAFIAELRAVVPFDRAAILLVEDDAARVMATAGVGEGGHLGPGTRVRIAGSILEPVVEKGETVHREDISQPRHREEAELLELGLRTRVLAPLQLADRAIGALSLSRREAHSFRREEIELLTLLGRLVASTVQNIRTYDAERASADELRRLSAMRADFVSLVSHELRSPMAAVIGSARTLQHRWEDLRPDQREAFLSVIGDETSRLAVLIGDVLDTSRIEAGTFPYTFANVDVAALVRDAVAAVEIGQEHVRINTRMSATLPRVWGDADRLRQLVDNLISNALKYSRPGAVVTVDARSTDRTVEVRVRDQGPGIPLDQQKLIFEKFGRAAAGRDAKPGTGLGLFISRSFAEAHGGSLEVESTPGQGATFTLTLPAAA
jgi:signal transduction histidine kinase